MSHDELVALMAMVETDKYRPEAIALVTAVLAAQGPGRVMVPALDGLDGMTRTEVVAMAVLLAEFCAAALLTVQAASGVVPESVVSRWALMG